MADYRIYFADGARREVSADRCRHTGASYIFEQLGTSGDWRIVHEIPVAEVAQLQDGVDLTDHP